MIKSCKNFEQSGGGFDIFEKKKFALNKFSNKKSYKLKVLKNVKKTFQ